MKRIYILAIFAMILVLGASNAYADKPDNTGKPDKGGGGGGGDKVEMCLDGESIMVPPKKVDSYLAKGARLLEPGDCCTNVPTSDYPDGIYDRWEWDWYTCSWFSVKHCEPVGGEASNPALANPALGDCHWCIFSCDWSCNANPRCHWIPAQEQMHVCGWSCF